MTTAIAIRTPPKRNQWGQYLLPPLDGSPDAWRGWPRVTTVIKGIEDTYNLVRWSERMLAIGLAHRPDLLALAASTPEHDRAALNDVCEKAKQAAKADMGANLGTAVHQFCEQADQGLKIVAGEHARDVSAYVDTMKRYGFEHTHIEAVLVNTELGVCGTADRLSYVRGLRGRYVVDIKGLYVGTPLPTPAGWTTMAEVAVGDEVFDMDGRVCRVTEKSVVRWVDCYRITFDDGSTVVCDADHRWLVDNGQRAEHRNVVTASEIAGSIFRGRQRQHRVPVAGPLDLPDVELPIDPYLLGVWLGDGSASGSAVTKPLDHPLWSTLVDGGHSWGTTNIDSRSGCATRRITGLRTALRHAGLLGNKHIPDAYMRASAAQRLALLQGLMDTDGTWHRTRHQAIFCTTDKALSVQVTELMASLGFRPYWSEVVRTGFGKTVTAYDVKITPTTCNPFRARAAACADRIGHQPTGQSNRRMIVSAEPIPSVPTQCITVDSPTHTYLCTERMVPTHNTSKSLDYSWGAFSAQLATYAYSSLIFDYGAERYSSMPDDVDKTLGFVAWVPIGAAECKIYAVDLVKGWEAAKTARWIYDWRSDSVKDSLWTPFEPAATGHYNDPTLDPTPGHTPPGSVEDIFVHEATIAWLKDRITTLQATDEDAIGVVAGRWPVGVPLLKKGCVHTPDQLQAIHLMLAEVEKIYRAPFPAPDPRV